MNSHNIGWDAGPQATADGFRAVRRRAVRRRARTTAGFTAPVLATLAVFGWSISTPLVRPDSLVATNHGTGHNSSAQGHAPGSAPNAVSPASGGASISSSERGTPGLAVTTSRPARSLPPATSGPATVHIAGSSTARTTWTVNHAMTLSFGAASITGSEHYVAVYVRGLDNAVSFGVARSPDVSYAIGQEGAQWLPFAAATGDLAAHLVPGRYQVVLVTDGAVDISVPADNAGATSLDLRPAEHVTAYVTHDVQGLGGTQTTLSRTYRANVTTHSVGLAIVGFREGSAAASANPTISLCLPWSGESCHRGDPQQTQSSSINIAALRAEVTFDHDGRMSPARDVSVTGSVSAGATGAVVVLIVNVDLGS